MAFNLETIADNLAELLTSVINTTTKFYDIFLNPFPKDVDIYVFNDENELVIQTIPNLAKARQAKEGAGSPESVVEATIGEIYVDTGDPSLSVNPMYIKTKGYGTNTGWASLATSDSIQDIINEYPPILTVNTLSGSGTLELADQKVYKVTTTGNVTFNLPTIDSGDLDSLHTIKVQLKIGLSGHQVSLGASYYIGDNTTGIDTSTSMLYDLIYEYDNNEEAWGVCVQKKVQIV